MKRILLFLEDFIPVHRGKIRIFSLSILITAVLLSVTFPHVVSLITDFVASYLSSDHSLKEVTQTDIRHYYAYFILLLLFGAIAIHYKLHTRVFNFMNGIIDFGKATSFVLNENASGNRHFPVYLFLLSTIPSMILVIITAFTGRPAQEGTLEKAEGFMLISSSVILAIAAIWKYPSSTYRTDKKGRIGIIVLSVILFLMFCEEISWGQRFLNYKSPEFFTEYNYQQEFNIHNFFNPVYDVIYKIIGISFFSGLLLTWLFGRKNSDRMFALFMPPSSMMVLVFLIACSAFGNREFFETLLYLFLLLYSMRIMMCLKRS
jgi:hypothetical protein